MYKNLSRLLPLYRTWCITTACGNAPRPKVGRPKGSTQAVGFAASTSRPAGTTKALQLLQATQKVPLRQLAVELVRVHGGRLEGNTQAAGYEAGRPIGTTQAAGFGVGGQAIYLTVTSLS